jgi:hypothetical protein
MTQPFDNNDWEVRKILERDLEIERLKALLTELADALDIHGTTYPGGPIEKLIQRAREAITAVTKP